MFVFQNKGDDMSNVSNIKPWFREDIARVLMSIYFTSISSGANSEGASEHYRTGFASALSSVAIMVGVNPESFLDPKDIRLIQSVARWD
jgi:hypothetical protein